MDRAERAIDFKMQASIGAFPHQAIWAAYMTGLQEGVEIGALDPELSKGMYELMEAREKAHLGDMYEPPEPGWAEFMEVVNG